MSEEGERKLGEFAPKWSEIAVDEIWSSDLIRAHATASAIGAVVKVPVFSTQLLREIDFGALDGAGRCSEFGSKDSARAADKYNFRPPGGETYKEVELRVARFFDSKIAGRVGTILIVTHLGVIRVLRRLADGVTEEEAANTFVDCLSVSVIDFERSMSVWGASIDSFPRWT